MIETLGKKYFEVTVKTEEVTGYNSKKQQDIVEKHTEIYLVEKFTAQEASEAVANDWKNVSSSISWRITAVKESKITTVI